MYLTGACIMAYNLWATVARQPRTASSAVAVPAE
jgi:cytochrome c oxidase cbb3-type subunit 1